MTVSTDITGGSSFATSMDLGSRPYLPEVSSVSGLTGQAPNDSIVSNPADTSAIEFRVSRAGESRRQLRLTGNRYTFGNAEGCAIRLNDTSLRPMHAVLIREATGVMVRTYSVPVDVNGNRVSEANLQVGDILRLGVYEFELLSIGKTAAESRPASPTSPANRGPIHGAATSGTASSARRELPPTDEVVWRERLRREVDQWRERQEDCNRREGRINEREAELRARESELWSRSDNLHRREARVQSQETETFHLYEEFAQHQQELIQLRDESQSRNEELHRRDAEFREQEFEYRRRLSEATTQLDHAKLQAEAAAQAVSRMREQFDALNAQISQLSNDQRDIEARENQQTDEFNRVRDELESAKAEAERGREDSERRRAEAEDRVAELSVEIESLKSSLGADFNDQQAELEESKRITEQLHDQIAELQRAVADASEESNRLRSDYEQSCEKVLQLEALVSESQQRGDEHRGEWAVEVEHLRAEVQRLSSNLAEANDQLAEIREANESLNQRLSDVRQERDDARVERDVRPTTEAFQKLREELDEANDQLTEIKRQYDEMLARLDEAQSIRSAMIPTALGLGSTVDSIENDSDSDADHDADDDTPGEPEAIASDKIVETFTPHADDDDVWPTYQSLTENVSADDANDGHVDNAELVLQSELEPILAYQPEPSPPEESVWGSATNVEESHEQVVEGEDSDSDEAVSNEFENPWQAAVADADVSDVVDDETVDDEASPVNQWTAPAETSQEESALEDSVASAWGMESAEPELDREVQSSDDPATDESPSNDIWRHTEIRDATDRPTFDESANDDGIPQWGSESDSESAEFNIENSIVSGSLANALIKELDHDREIKDETDSDRLAGLDSDASDDDDSSSEQPEVTHAGTFLLSEDSETPSWEPNNLSPELNSDSDELGDNDEPNYGKASTSPWDDVSDQSHDFLEVDHAADAEFDAPIEETVRAPVDATAQMDEVPSEDDDSIEAYMNRLLRRVQGGDENSETAPMPETISVSTSQSLSSLSKSKSKTNPSEEASITQSHPIDHDAPLVPRSQAPERSGNLSAMRDLANSSARSAISRSARVQSRDTQIQAMVSLACAVGALGCNAFAFYFLEGILLIVAVVMTLVVAYCCFSEGIHLLREAKRRVQSADPGDDSNERNGTEEVAS